MALGATIYKATLQIADNDRGYYGTHALTLARHPSETDERMMVRLLAFGLLVRDDDDSLGFARGLSEVDDPALWRLDLTGAIQTWVDVGLPDERRLLKAIGKADDVQVFAYGRTVDLWWNGVRNRLSRARKLQVHSLDAEGTQALAGLAQRTMTLNLNIQDRSIWVSSDAGEATVTLQTRFPEA